MNDLPPKNASNDPFRNLHWYLLTFLLAFLLNAVLFSSCGPRLGYYPESALQTAARQPGNPEPPGAAMPNALPARQDTLRDYVERAALRVEVRLRDHITFLLAAAGIATTLILSIFTLLQNQRDRKSEEEARRFLEKMERMDREMTEKSREMEAMQREAVKKYDAICTYEANTRKLSSDASASREEEKLPEEQKQAAKAVAESPESQPAFLAAGLESYDRKDYAEALVFFEKYLEGKPRDAAVLIKAAYAATELSKKPGVPPAEKQTLRDNAEKRYRACLDINDRIVVAWNNWGNLCAYRAFAAKNLAEKKTFLQQAEEKFQRATALDPQYAPAWNNWGNLLKERAQIATADHDKKQYRQQAEEKFQRAATLDPKYTLAWSNWGNLLRNCARVATDADERETLRQQAEEKYRRAVALDPRYAPAWGNWGALLGDRMQSATKDDEKNTLLAKAEKKFQRATTLDPSRISSWNGWGCLLLACAQAAVGQRKQEYLQQAEEKLARAAALDRPGSLYNLACLAAVRGKTELCLSLLEESYAAGMLPSLKHLKKDIDLEPIRQSEDYKAFVEKVQKEREE